jgi:hypothetical protein
VPAHDRPPLYQRPLPNGWHVAICPTSSGNPPGHVGGMATASSELWCRLRNPGKVNPTTGPDGWDSGWHRVELSKSLFTVRAWWDLVESEADIREAWLITVGGAYPPPRYDSIYALGVEWLETLS